MVVTKPKVFLSSTTKDLCDYRQAAREAILSLGDYDIDYMERWPATSKSPIDVIREHMEACKVYVGIIGSYYGDSPPGFDKSFTELEYEEASNLKIPRLLFLTSEDLILPVNDMEEEKKRNKLQAFRRRISNELVFSRFSNTDQLKHVITVAFYEGRRTGWRKNLDIRDWDTVRRAYLHRVSAHFEDLNARYTELRVTSDIRVATYKGKRLARNEQAQPIWLAELFCNEEISRESRCVVILGDPGSGKTTACQRAGWLLAQESLTALEDNRHANTRIPVYVDLGKFRRERFKDLPAYKIILSLVALEMERLLASGYPGIQILQVDVDFYIREAPFVFFFDGLNEVGCDHRLSVIEAIDEFIKLHLPKTSHQFVITTRKMDYEYEIQPSLPIERFPALEILEFDSAGVNELIIRDLGNADKLRHLLSGGEQQTAIKTLDILISGKTADPWEAIAQIENIRTAFRGNALQLFEDRMKDIRFAQRLVDELRKPEYARILWLSQNPSTLRDIIDVFRHTHGHLPESKIQLLEKAVLARMDYQEKKEKQSAKQRSIVPRGVKVKVMQLIAFRMTDPTEGLQLDHNSALSLVDKVRTELNSSLESKDVLDSLILDDELLTERAEGFISFVKQPYQEYFAVCEIRDRWCQKLKEHDNPMHDPRLKPFFLDRTFFQITSGIVGILESAMAGELVYHLEKRKKTRLLAAMCIRNLARPSQEMLKAFLDSTTRRIMRFAKLPQDAADLGFMLLLLAATIIASVHLSVYSIFEAFSVAMSLVCRSLLHALSPVIIVGGLGAAFWAIARYSSGIQNEDPRYLTFHRSISHVWLVAALALPLPIILGLKAGPGYINLMAAVALLSVMYALHKLLVFFSVSALNVVTINFEEYLVKKHLIPQMTILRELGPEATSTVRFIQQAFREKDLMSPRIIDAVQRTWAVSPKTVFQLVESANDPKSQAEAIELLVNFFLSVDTPDAERKKALSRIFDIAKASSLAGTASYAIEELGHLGRENPTIRSHIENMLRSVLTDTTRNIRLRRHAYRELEKIGVKDMVYPHPNSSEVRRKRLRIVTTVFVIIIAFWSTVLLSRCLSKDPIRDVSTINNQTTAPNTTATHETANQVLRAPFGGKEAHGTEKE